MFKDTVTINVKSGKGGHGSLAMKLDMPDGGNGGAGGNIYLRGDENLNDLGRYSDGSEFVAERGGDGGKKRKTGNKGKDTVLLVPITTEVFVEGKKVELIKEHREKLKILKGGHGGFGSIAFAKGKVPYLDKENEVLPKDAHDVYLGQEGRSLRVKLVLKLLADVIFVGYPNAGKSSLLNALTRAHVKTADYAFTTLQPQIGLMEGIRLMDLPGLIDGTSEGRGLGTSWVKHTQSAKVLAHVVSLENEDVAGTYRAMREELEKIDEGGDGKGLRAKPELVILSKSDEASEEKRDKVIREFEQLGIRVVVVSVLDDQALESLKGEIKERL